MTHDEYVARVLAGDYPDDPRVPLGRKFENAAGVIENLLHAPMGGAALIVSEPLATRSNHYHKTDWHFMYVVDGVMSYWWRPVGSQETPQVHIFRPGTMMFTPPLVEHATHFHDRTTLIVLSRNPRNHESHEADLVRVDPLVFHNDKATKPCP